MKLLPTLKQKKRYVVFEIATSGKYSETEVKEAVSKATKDFLGVYGLARAGIMFIKHKNNKFIIKVNHKYVDQCKSAIILIKKIKEKPVIIKSVITTGMVKKAII
jgi:ribonuclease P/MRP protein subunit POP5